VPTGWQVAFRSRHIYGPYEEKIVLERGSTRSTAAQAHSSICQRRVVVHPFPGCRPLRRITHLQPVTWQDGWPLMGVDYDGNGVGEPVTAWKKPGVAARARSPCRDERRIRRRPARPPVAMARQP